MLYFWSHTFYALRPHNVLFVCSSSLFAVAVAEAVIVAAVAEVVLVVVVVVAVLVVGG